MCESSSSPVCDSQVSKASGRSPAPSPKPLMMQAPGEAGRPADHRAPLGYSGLDEKSSSQALPSGGLPPAFMEVNLCVHPRTQDAGLAVRVST